MRSLLWVALRWLCPVESRNVDLILQKCGSDAKAIGGVRSTDLGGISIFQVMLWKNTERAFF